MSERIITIPTSNWLPESVDPNWIQALEEGKVLYFPNLSFALNAQEQQLLTPNMLAPKARNISLDANKELKGAQGDITTQQQLAEMIGRYRAQALQLVHALAPDYADVLRIAPTSFRPMSVSERKQSWRADDRRMHVDAFPSRPTYGERILRVFTNINPNGEPRVWRVGESFTSMTNTMLPRIKKYSPLQAKLLNSLGITKNVRSEYDHIMLQLHDQMKADMDYQANSAQEEMHFPPGSVWVCFADQAIHGVMSGQYMMEQTLHIAPADQYNPSSSPLGILKSITGRKLVA